LEFERNGRYSLRRKSSKGEPVFVAFAWTSATSLTVAEMATVLDRELVGHHHLHFWFGAEGDADDD
jgi:hypothetical protein